MSEVRRCVSRHGFSSDGSPSKNWRHFSNCLEFWAFCAHEFLDYFKDRNFFKEITLLNNYVFQKKLFIF